MTHEQVEIDRVAEAIYMTHWKETESYSPPTWENVSDIVREWVRAQAVSARRACGAR